MSGICDEFGGSLTAEQAREIWNRHFKSDCIYDPPTPDWQAISDELNATLGRDCESMYHELTNAVNELQKKQPYCYNPDKPIETLQTIGRFIDELNAALGGAECTPHGEWESISQSQEVRHVFCDCGYELGMDERDSWPIQSTRLFAMPNYCQECGRKIRKAVG